MSEGKIKGCAKEKKSKKDVSKKSFYPPSEMYLTVLGNGSSSSSRSLYMFTDREKYLFNCGEGTQRLASEHKMKLSKLEHVFVTHNSWENLGGLLGLSLTIQDMGVSDVTIHGPPGIDSLYRYTESFIFLPNLNIATRSYSDESFKDECMEVHYIPIFKSPLNSGKSMNSEDTDDLSEHKSKKLRVNEQERDCDMAMCFACKGHSKPGRIMLEKCVEFGVPVGPLLGNLKNGKDVTLPSGKVVLSKDVVTEEEVCPRFLVVECPSEDFLDPFVNEDKFRPLQEDESALTALVVHFTPNHILNTPQYQKWIQRFPSTTCHLILNDNCPSLNSLANHRLQHQLNLLHPGMFTLLQEEEEINENSSLKDNVIHAQTLERYYLRPAKGLDRSFGIKIEPSEYVQEALKLEKFRAQLKDLECSIRNSSKNSNNELYPEVSFLGTGSSIPNKARNVSAILVHTSEKKCLLMDCGEGTYGQLLRLYREQYKDILLQLYCVFISHMHADHHLGLIKILKARQELYKSLKKDYESVLVIGPIELDPWLRNYYGNFESSTPLYRFSECSELEENIFTKAQTNNEIENCKDILVSTVPVNHCKDAHGVIVSSKSNEWKIVYSGDTVPCKRLISAGKDCSLLIHEATMEDELATEAAFKRHSTTSQAIKVAEEMNAKYTILTHFSQRYAKVPIFNENFHNRVGCAFDNMKVRPSEYHILPLLIPSLNSLFAEHIEELQTKTDKRRKREELMKKMMDESLTEIKCTSKS